ncbi:MAG: putative DNA-binding protein (MmcQ/YjbR family) [Verrucomicrobiales bacterium]|jgi:predicted DNA-binding protein (MmcQ/YjbR family)
MMIEVATLLATRIPGLQTARIMFADEMQQYLLSRPFTTEEQPFGPDVLVYKVKGKMFATLGIDDDDGTGRVNLKCNPDRAIELREEHRAILPGYHMNKRHWNTLVLDGSLADSLVRELVDHSWDLVVAGLPKKVRDILPQE